MHFLENRFVATSVTLASGIEKSISEFETYQFPYNSLLELATSIHFVSARSHKLILLPSYSFS